MTNGNQKGKRGEREAAKVLTAMGQRWTRRLGQSRGSVGGGQPPDVVLEAPYDAWHAQQGPEVKYGANVSLRAAWRQACAESVGSDRVPWVLARRVGRGRRGRKAEGWVLACRARDWWTVWLIVGDPRRPTPALRTSAPRATASPWRSLHAGSSVQVWPEGDTMCVVWVDDYLRARLGGD